MTKFLSFFTFLFVFNADSNKELASTYINAYKEVAISEMHRTGIPASIKLAQGLLESNWGRSELATVANNHFGIKCGSYWDGKTFYKEDDDRNKRGDLIKSCFRSFDSPMESYMAHSNFLTDPKKTHRYGFLFGYHNTDYKSWAHGLKKSGYATDPKYPQKLIDIIERYNLYEYDNQTNSKKSPQDTKLIVNTSSQSDNKTVDSVTEHAIRQNNDINPQNSSRVKRSNTISHSSKRDSRMPAKHVSRLKYSIKTFNDCRKVVAKGGETLEQLSQQVGISIDDILLYNDIYDSPDDVLASGSPIYLEKKKRGYRGTRTFHKVREGETMSFIAQKYAIRLSSLYAKNRMKLGYEPLPREKVFLYKTAKISEKPKTRKVDKSNERIFLFEE